MKKLLTIAAMTFTTTAFASWEYRSMVDPMTDREDGFAAVLNKDKQLLMIRCVDSKLDLLVNFAEHISLEDYVPVSYRFDKEVPVDSGNWSTSTSSKAVFAPERTLPVLLENIKTSKQMIIQTRSYQNSNITAVFDLTGSTSAINQLNCK